MLALAFIAKDNLDFHGVEKPRRLYEHGVYETQDSNGQCANHLLQLTLRLEMNKSAECSAHRAKTRYSNADNAKT